MRGGIEYPRPGVVIFCMRPFRSLRIIALLPLVMGSLAYADATVAYETTADWGTEFTGQITITNNGTSAVGTWTLEFDFAPMIVSIWDAQVSQHNGSHYVIISAGWNDTISAGGSVVFGFSGSPGNVATGPQNIKFTATNLSPAAAPITISVTENAASANQFSAAMTIANPGSAAISPWTLDFNCDRQIQSASGAVLSSTGAGYQLQGSTLAAAGQVVLTLSGAGNLDWSSFSQCVFNGSSCQIVIGSLAPAQTTTSAIVIQGVDPVAGSGDPALQIALNTGTSSYALSMSTSAPAQYNVTVSNSAIASAAIAPAGTLEIMAKQPGRTSIKIEDSVSGATRFVGVRVNGPGGVPPRLPDYLSLGSVSEDTDADLAFWEAFQPGPKNRRVDIRYIYLNGGPVNGWDTWGSSPGSRAVTYIRNSRMLGLIPFFVFYNIPDSSEGYLTDLQHAQDATYMQAYFKNLKLALDIINEESPNDIVGIVLEPDFIGYLAQNANQPASQIAAMASAAYSAGVLTAGTDPAFPNTVQGLVEAINYTISKYDPQVFFGWQMNLWASPAGGFTTPIPGNGIMHITDTVGVAAGRPLIYNEAAAITRYYLDAGIAKYGASFVSVDKYGLDATGFQASAAQDPAGSVWFWNNDQWQNYLTFVKAMHTTSNLPVILWQLPVGHINSSLRADPYSNSGTFADLTDSNGSLEDSSSTFFFGDRFVASGARFAFFSTNNGGDPKVKTDGQQIEWGEHLSDAKAAGVIAALFGAGVGASTTNIGDPPSDSYWWISAAQEYYDRREPFSLYKHPPRR